MKHYTTCIRWDAAAGGTTNRPTSNVLVVSVSPMSIAPSTIWAAKPIGLKGTSAEKSEAAKSVTRLFLHRFAR
ncbi:hypothetical protein GRI43_12025 [Altererythrobacter luteolus]|uniref:Uncharacterized protein n=1 Tax=Pontixanthobacter luteolus TaxID=295089 RepID=A0A6I4V753_9SPHN|nr:hypothetical protein [Pontixanthobacter luteolus]MXP48114.1 hypothetical protein [Pontixanthobacter luteolus]